MAGGQPIGPFLIGLKHAAHILTPSVTVRGIINNTAMAVADAQRCCEGQEEKKLGRNG